MSTEVQVLDPSSSNFEILAIALTQVLQGNTGPQGPIGPVGPSGNAVARSQIFLNTTEIEPGATIVGTVALGKTFTLIGVTVNFPARIELYATAASQAADASRPSTTPPTPNTPNGIITDLSIATSDQFNWIMSPPSIGSNMETIPSANITYAVTNLDTVPRTIQVIFTVLTQEF